MAKETRNVNKSDSSSTAAMMRVALVVLIFPQVLGFHMPPSFRVQNGATSPSCRSIASINENNPPRCLHASAEGSGAEVGGRNPSRAAAAASAPLSLPTVLEESPLRILDPAVRETGDGYALTFNLPTEVTEDGLDLSVSGRLLTIEARVTRESADGSATRSTTRTHATARSFILPDDASDEVTASWVADDEVEVRLTKVASDVATSAYFPASGRSSSSSSSSSSAHFSSMEDSGGIPVENRRKETEPSAPSSSAAEEYLPGLESVLGSAGLDPATPSSADKEPSARPARQQRQRRSLLAALDDEFRDLARAMWAGDNAVRFPTEEQAAATVERAREERKKRVTALRRATMATHVSEKELAYVVKVALPRGATRDDVKLMVTPYNNDLRVIFFAEDHRTVSKAVHLPRDALFTDISAAFTPETVSAKDREGVSDASANDARKARGGRSAASGSKKRGGDVSSLEITVGRVLPKSIDIK